MIVKQKVPRLADCHALYQWYCETLLQTGLHEQGSSRALQHLYCTQIWEYL